MARERSKAAAEQRILKAFAAKGIPYTSALRSSLGDNDTPNDAIGRI